MKGITALVLAAGLSSRMGQPKLVLPWGEKKILPTVLDALKAGGVESILVVTGGSREQVERVLAGSGAATVHNRHYRNGEMLESFKAGLAGLPDSAQAALVTLGDQPQILPGTVRAVLEVWQEHPGCLVIPSYQMRRGHPWVLPRRFWAAVQGLEPPKTLRDFLSDEAEDIIYVNVDTGTILEDIDTPEDYRQAGGMGILPS